MIGTWTEFEDALTAGRLDDAAVIVLKQEDRDRHYMERSARRNGWTITPAGRD